MSNITRASSPDEVQIQYTVLEDENGSRLDHCLQKYFQSFSRNKIQKKIESGSIHIKNRSIKIKPSTKILKDDIIVITTKKEDFPVESWNGQPLDLQKTFDIIYEDQDCVAINKPPFMATHPSGTHLFYCATVHLDSMGRGPAHTVHRLDRETSGILLFARSAASSTELTTLFEQKKVQKLYFLIAHKPQKNMKFPHTTNKRMGLVDGFDPRQFMHCFDEKSPRGKAASTTFYLVKELEKHLIVLAKPHTGRQHQIRSHAAELGMHLLGDKMYHPTGPGLFIRHSTRSLSQRDFELLEIPRHALHAIALKVPSDNAKTWTTPIPDDLCQWLREKEVDIKTIETKTNHLIQTLIP